MSKIYLIENFVLYFSEPQMYFLLHVQFLKGFFRVKVMSALACLLILVLTSHFIFFYFKESNFFKICLWIQSFRSSHFKVYFCKQQVMFDQIRKLRLWQRFSFLIYMYTWRGWGWEVDAHVYLVFTSTEKECGRRMSPFIAVRSTERNSGDRLTTVKAISTGRSCNLSVSRYLTVQSMSVKYQAACDPLARLLKRRKQYNHCQRHDNWQLNKLVAPAKTVLKAQQPMHVNIKERIGLLSTPVTTMPRKICCFIFIAGFYFNIYFLKVLCG